MLKFLGDETGVDKKPTTRISAVAGLVGGEKAWKRFDREWSGVLEEESIPVFHATDCEFSHGEFKGMDVIKRGRVADKLVSAILGSSLQPCSYSVVIPHFNAMPDAFKNHFTNSHPEIPYYLCLQQTFVAASHVADDMPADEQVHFLFEKQNQFEQEASWLFGEFKKNVFWPNHTRLGQCHFIPEEDEHLYPGLQAADLMAYESYRHLDNAHFLPNLRAEWKVRTAFQRLGNKLGKYGRQFNDVGLAM